MPQPSSTFRVQLPVPARVVVLVSGSGTLLQALLDAAAEPGYPAEVVAVGADRAGIEGLARAERAGVPTFVESVRDASRPRRVERRAHRRPSSRTGPTSWSAPGS